MTQLAAAVHWTVFWTGRGVPLTTNVTAAGGALDEADGGPLATGTAARSPERFEHPTSATPKTAAPATAATASVPVNNDRQG